MDIRNNGRFRLGRRRGVRLEVDGLGGGGIAYLLRDLFTTAIAAGAVNGTAAEPGPGTRTVVDTNSKLSITGSAASFATGGVGYGDPGLWYPAVARAFGRTLLAQLTGTLATGSEGTFVGWDNSQASLPVNAFYMPGSGLVSAYNNSVAVVVGTIADSTLYTFAIVLRSTGAYFFIKGGVYTAWTLVWISAAINSASMFPNVSGKTATVFTADNIRVPDALYTVPVLAYDTFTRANGALGSSEAAGPDGQAVAARAWTGATFAIASNGAVNTPTLGADVIVNGDFATDTDWTKGAGWTIVGGVAQATAASAQLTQVFAVVGIWYSITFTVLNYSAGLAQAFIGASTPAKNANGTYTVTVRATSTTGGISAPGGSATYQIDDFSAKAIPVAELFASLQVSTADVLADVNVTMPSALGGYQSGLVVSLDSASSPLNFIIAYLDGVGAAKLDQCVAGVYTNIISAAVTYSAGATLRVVKSGVTVSLFYNGVAVGTTQNVAAAAAAGVLHGLFSTSPLNSLDSFQVLARGTGNEFSGLDAF